MLLLCFDFLIFCFYFLLQIASLSPLLFSPHPICNLIEKRKRKRKQKGTNHFFLHVMDVISQYRLVANPSHLPTVPIRITQQTQDFLVDLTTWSITNPIQDARLGSIPTKAKTLLLPNDHHSHSLLRNITHVKLQSKLAFHMICWGCILEPMHTCQSVEICSKWS